MTVQSAGARQREFRKAMEVSQRPSPSLETVEAIDLRKAAGAIELVRTLARKLAATETFLAEIEASTQACKKVIAHIAEQDRLRIASPSGAA